ncbi:zinc-binding dehydrogenase [Aeromicrobium alkaliterrae]|uniref:NADPH:quinone oxidoreductase family protein n=1 Tax=Aeromicrobium alkaliterrae TaxID=302168 RepID=A0ABN2K000_9ACTN
MKRVVTHELGDLANLVLEAGAAPEPVEGEIPVAMRASVVSYVNAVLAGGQYQVPPPVPFVPGTTGVGVLLADSPDGRLSRGERVATTRLSGGCWTTHAQFAPALLVPVPDAVTDVLAAAVLEAWCTMHFAFTRRRPLSGTEVVLVLGASGAIGSAAVDVARASGARVLAVGSRSERLAPAQRLGAEPVVVGPGADETLTQAVRRLAPGGVDVVVDPVGGDLATESLKLLAPWGELLVLGFASGTIPRLGANRVLIGNRRITGVDLGFAITRDLVEGQAVMSEVLERVAAGDYGREVDPDTCTLDEVPDRLRAVLAREVSGQVVVMIETDA